MQHTLEQVRTAMQEIVESKPEGFGYKDVHEGWHPASAGSMCKYVIDYQPACIVGQVGYILGESMSALMDWEGADAISLTSFNPDAGQYLQHAQIVQDKGFTWALAYQAAELTLILGTRVSNKEWDR